MGEMLLVQGPACTQSHLYSQTFLTIIWWQCRAQGCSHPCETLHFLLFSLFQRMMFRHPSEVRGSPPSCLGDALESTRWVKSVTLSAGATPDGPVQAITNTTSADPISPLTLLSSCLCVAEPGKHTFHSWRTVAKGTLETL